MTISAALYQKSIPPSTPSNPTPAGTNAVAGTVCLVFIFLFGAVYSVGFTPLQALYPVEVLSFEMRAKGMGFSGFAVAAGRLDNVDEQPEGHVLMIGSTTSQSVCLARSHG